MTSWTLESGFARIFTYISEAVGLGKKMEKLRNQHFGALLEKMTHFDLPKLQQQQLHFLNSMKRSSRSYHQSTAATPTTSHVHWEVCYQGLRLTPLPPTSKTDENPAASAAGGLELAETRSLLHVGWESRVVYSFLSLTIKKFLYDALCQKVPLGCDPP